MTASTRGRPATVKDVARQAGVSPSTVSNVLHGRASVAAPIRERVEVAVAEVGYVPSVVGRQLRSGTSDVIQLALPDIRSPYYSALAHTVIRRARELGRTVVIEETDGAVEQEQRVATGHPHRGIGGTLICPVALTSDDLADLRPTTPTVLLGEHTRGDAFDQVFIDSRAAAREVATHLIAAGRRRFAFVGTEHGPTPGPGVLRLQGVRDVLADEGLDLPGSAVLATADFGREAGVAVPGRTRMSSRRSTSQRRPGGCHRSMDFVPIAHRGASPNSGEYRRSMGSDAEEALGRLGAERERHGEQMDASAVATTGALVREAHSLGASDDEIATAGGLSIGWVRSILGLHDSPLLDRQGQAIWVI
ncbi:LacI family DNA-binding transcriptional regulator [Promicromonospora sp. MS192]|uniref:LacI family DNA-binding transcriptional regulator n=1 Tax=Promicromonospora sp. MS192 TaxID=3412684 RepID=UPI003C2B2BBE